MIFNNPPEVIAMLVPVLLFSLCFHEFSHAAVARALGDPTAQRAGRLTLNPLAHLDVVGTLLLLFIGFGYAKPVPVDIRNLKHPRRDDTWIALAGPGSNLLLAIVTGLLLRFVLLPRGMALLGAGQAAGDVLESVIQMTYIAVQVNLSLAVFNILPIYPLDGSHVMENSLPLPQAMKFRETARYSMIFFFIIMLVPGASRFVFAPARWLSHLILGLG